MCNVRDLAVVARFDDSSLASPLSAINPSANSSVQAPGCGVHARIWRSMASAGSAQLMRASSTVILCAYSKPSAGCGVNTAVPLPTAARASTYMGAPSSAKRASSSPEVSRPVSSMVNEAIIGPSSKPSPTLNTSAPVVGSPFQIARWAGAAPRHFGRLEKCRLYQPIGTASNTDLGRILP